MHAISPPFSNFLRCVPVSAFLALAAAASAAETVEPPSPLATNPRYTGSPFLRTWLADDYGASPENFCVLQHPRTGLIYVGNASGVLEFDGVRWRLIDSSDRDGEVTSLCVDRRGRIWGFGRTKIIRLEPDARGELRAYSMHSRLPAAFRPRNFVYCSVATSHGVYFCDRGSLIFFGDGDGPPQAWRVAEGAAEVTALWQINDEPYVQLGAPANRVVRRRGERFEEVPSLDRAVLAAKAEPNGGWQLSTVRGIQWWDGTRITRVQRPLEGDETLRSVFLADGRIALATVNRGLVICDREGRVLQALGRMQGLPSNQVRGLATDREGGLWTAQPGGIVRLQLDSPYARHGPKQGLEGSADVILRHRGELYVGGSEGVFRRDPDGLFRAQPKLPSQILRLVSHNDWLFAMSTGQTSALEPGPGDSVRQLEHRVYWGLLPLAGAPGWYAYGARDGLHWAHFVGDKWVSGGPLRSAKGAPTVRLESPPGVVWAWAGGAALRVDFRGGLRPDAPVRVFDAAEGIPGGPFEMFLLGGEVVTRVDGELRRFDEKNGRFERDTRVVGLEGYPIAKAWLSHTRGILWLQAGEPSREFRRVVPEAADPSHPEKVTRWRAEALPGDSLTRLLSRTFFPDEAAQTLWIGGNDAIVSYDLTWQETRPVTPPVAVVRRIETEEGYLIAARDSPGMAALSSALPSEQNNLRISFAAPSYTPDQTGVVHTEYRTRLEGIDRGWTTWSQQAERNLSNLPWRDFTFRVQARDDAGRIGPEATLAFSIRPAWWATRWAWAGYGALGLLGMVGVVRLRTQELRRRARRLEEIVNDRTRELAHSNAQLATSNTELARLHQLELDEKIAAQLSEEKARLEVLRYQLNPHFLYNSLNSIYGLLFENARDAGEMVLRLSDFCRAALTGAKDELPTLEAELAALRTYLDVEKVRWNERLQTEFAVAPDVTLIRIPPFLLLPLVENAIKYGVRTTPGTLRLSIRAFSLEREKSTGNGHAPRALVIEIANTGEWVPPGPSRPDSTGIGLENLRQRLRRYYPEAHEFTTEAKDGWVVARLRLDRALEISPRPPGQRERSNP